MADLQFLHVISAVRSQETMNDSITRKQRNILPDNCNTILYFEQVDVAVECFLVRASRPTSQLLQRSAHLYYTAPLRGDSFSLQASQGINNSFKCLHSYSGILNYSPVLKWLKGKMEIAIST